MSEIKSYRDLIVWQKSMDLVNKVYRLTHAFPSEEKFALTSQLRRSIISIPSNIAEGYGRNSTQDYVWFLNIACGSLYESQTLLELSYQLGYLNEENYKPIYENTREIERMLNSLIRKLSP